jgi:hypothetical protein
MYKSNYFTEEQMMMYKMQRDADKVWTTTLQFFTELYAQCKVYSDDGAANSGFDSAALVHKYPPNQSNCTVASTTSDITTQDLYVKSLKAPGNVPWPRSLTRRPFYTRNSKPNASSSISSRNRMPTSSWPYPKAAAVSVVVAAVAAAAVTAVADENNP